MNGPEDSEREPVNPQAGGKRELPPTNEWDSDEALSALTEERRVLHGDSITDEQYTRKLLEAAAPAAAAKIIHIGQSSQNDNTALAANRFIVEYVLEAETEGGKAGWEKLLGEVVDTAEILTSQASNGRAGDQ
jgi:hypothetical protein